jgi:hypothetical protein
MGCISVGVTVEVSVGGTGVGGTGVLVGTTGAFGVLLGTTWVGPCPGRLQALRLSKSSKRMNPKKDFFLIFPPKNNDEMGVAGMILLYDTSAGIKNHFLTFPLTCLLQSGILSQKMERI